MRALLSLLPVLLSLPALAAPPVASPYALCETAIASAEFAGRLPPRLLTAIAQQESGRPDEATGRTRPWPWTVNADGEGRFFASKADAVKAVQALQARGVRSIDVGCMQVNLMYHPDAFASLEEAFDPWHNATYATRFLNALYTESHDWQRSIAAYHSETPVLGDAYRALVVARWQRPTPGTTPAASAQYQDFQDPSRVYGAFAPTNQAYGAFATPRR